MDYMKRLGYNPTDAQIFYNYGRSKQKTSKATTAADLQKLSLGNAASLYDDAVITKDDYISILESHGYSADAATLTVELADIKNAQAARKQFATQMIDEVKLGYQTIDQAVSQLYSNGFTEAEVLGYQTKMTTAKKAALKLPSRAELDSMAKKGIITQADWENAMLSLNYDPTWIPQLWAIL